MKSVLIAGLMILWFWGCSSKAQVNDKVIVKSKEIRQSLKKEGINSYFCNDTLHVINKSGKELKKVYIHLKKFENEFKVDFDTLYSIEQRQDSKYLFIVLGTIGDVSSNYWGLLDINTKNWLVEQRYYENKNNDWGLPNVAYLGSSKNNEFHLFEGGTSGGERGFEVFNSKNKSLKRGAYFTDGDENHLKWMKGNKFYYYYGRDEKDSLPKNLPKLEEGRFYAQKYFWVNGKDSIVKEYKDVYVE